MINLHTKSLYSQDEMREVNYLLKTRGYAIFSDYLNLHETSQLKKVIKAEIDNYSPVNGSERSIKDRYHMHHLLCTDINFCRLLEDPRLQQILSPHLGEYWIMYAATSSSVPPYGTNFANRIHVDSPRFQQGFSFNMGVIWALDEYTLENGSVELLPGSQHLAEEPSNDVFSKHCLKLTCSEGSLIVFDARVYHRTSPNKTSLWRHSMTLNACRSFMKSRMDWVRFIPEHYSSQLNAQAKRIIGFDTRLPTNLNEFFLPEEQRLYKANQG